MSVAEVQDSTITATTDKRQATNAMIASLLGWSLDLFDLFILAKTPVALAKTENAY